MRILQKPIFKKVVKKLYPSQKQELDEAISAILQTPTLGVLKLGDLVGVRVYKFRMQGQQMLLAYLFDETTETLTLLALGSHENFYRDLKKWM